MNNHDIDYKLHGDDMQFVEIELDPNETVVAEAGSLMMMEDGISMETIFGDGSQHSSTGGIMGKLFSAGKRVITGESLFMTSFTNSGMGKRHVSFAAPYPGKIIPLDLSELEGKIICQKDAFLAAAKGVSVGVEFQRRIGAGFFGGDLQNLAVRIPQIQPCVTEQNVCECRVIGTPCRPQKDERFLRHERRAVVECHRAERSRAFHIVQTFDRCEGQSCPSAGTDVFRAELVVRAGHFRDAEPAQGFVKHRRASAVSG